jgi:4-amino-4-deoxy-L-arabinose transferase-like glycosyltransferase
MTSIAARLRDALRSLTPIQALIALAVLVNASALFSPIINSGDAVTYASIAQHMAAKHDWVRLVLDQQDWLDKPHFPFWMTALSFRLGGVSAFTYILPGFLFHLLGAGYTYRLARLWYAEAAAWLSVLLYVSIFSLMDSGIEIKAEAYLRGEILGACYHWLRCDAQYRHRDLVLGAVYTGLAIMTKGIFCLFTIVSGFLCLWMYRRQWTRPFRLQWLTALGLSLVCATPELLALHSQFQSPTVVGQAAHPTSAFQFFFWDSQFGRFFNTGPIQNHDGYPLYFVLVFLWAFMPWTLCAGGALVHYLRRFKSMTAIERDGAVFLVTAFGFTFIVFSATKFQMSYYIDILLPFAAILCAQYLTRIDIGKAFFLAQLGVLAFLTSLVVGLTIYLMNPRVTLAVLPVAVAAVATHWALRRQPRKTRLISYSVYTMLLIFVFSATLSYSAFSRYSLAIRASQSVGAQRDVPVYVYQMPEVTREMRLYSHATVVGVDTADDLAAIRGPYYLIVRHEQVGALPADWAQSRVAGHWPLVAHKTGTLDKLLKLARGTWPLEWFDTLEGRR